MDSAPIATQTSKTRILTRIERFAPGKTFTAKDFLDIASRGMVDMTLTSHRAERNDSPHSPRSIRRPQEERSSGGRTESGHRRGSANARAPLSMEDRAGGRLGGESAGDLHAGPRQDRLPLGWTGH